MLKNVTSLCRLPLLLLLLTGLLAGPLAAETASESAAQTPQSTYKSAWPKHTARTWIGQANWANRLQDWQIANGRLECLIANFGLPMRTVHCLTHRLSDAPGDFEVSVRLGLIQPLAEVSEQTAGGFLIGVGGKEMDYRAAAIVHDAPGPGAGIFAGVNSRGTAFIQDNEELWRMLPVTSKDKKPGPTIAGEMKLRLTGARKTDDTYEITVFAYTVGPDAKQTLLSKATRQFPVARFTGNVALVSHSGPRLRKALYRLKLKGELDDPDIQESLKAGRFWFRDWTITGSKIDVDNARRLGPILSAQHTLSRGVLKLTAQMMPLGEFENDSVTLQAKQGGEWKTIAETGILRPSYIAPFRVTNWDATKDTPYRVVYDLKLADGTTRTTTWEGTIRRDPVDKETIVVAGFTGNHNNSHRIGRATMRIYKERNRFPTTFDWVTGMHFPHQDLTARVAKHHPDLLFFSGDQVYEHSSPSGVGGGHIEMDYLYKWYLWCWAYRDLTRNRPVVAIPDDHDVYQSNLWGEHGRLTRREEQGGYTKSASFVKMVELTQTSHLPDPVDPRPVSRGIDVYFTHMTYGRIGMAILEDRKFKSGPLDRIECADKWSPDYISDPDYDRKSVDLPGLKLLGDRQLEFLNQFSKDWTGEDMKLALSQTIFANAATHHGSRLHRVIADLDSNGWPQTGRNKALAELRRGFVLHIAGDQHLASIVHHGIDDHNDAVWSFCVPSIVNFHSRAWKPETEGKNRAPGAPAHLGEHIDGFGNRITVSAVANPANMTGESFGVEPLDLHDNMPGYGIVKLNKNTREITMECWPRHVDPEDPATGTQYKGWPKTVSQLSNYGRKPEAYLPTIVCTGMKNPVVQVMDATSKETVYSLRINGTTFKPMVFKKGLYDVAVGEPNTEKFKVLRGVAPLKAGEDKELEVAF